VLSSELNEIAKALPQTTAGVALRSHLLTAYTREVRRAGSVIVADGREQREASERLRLRAKAVRDASARAAARSRLRVLPDTPIANLASLQRALESGGGGFRRSARSLAAPLSGLLA
jgi:hypothetical protein